jgi:magnesium transporter
VNVQKTFQRLIELIRERDEKLQGFLENLHPSDLAELVEDLSDQQKQEFFALLSDEDAAEIIQEMEEFDQVTLFRLLTRKRASAILREMALDDAVDLLGEMEDEESREILTLLKEEAAEIRGLLQYPEDSAGGIMTTEFTALPHTLNVAGAIQRLREIAPDAETIYYVYVVDDEKRLMGVVSLRELFAAKDSVLVKEIMRTNVIMWTYIWTRKKWPGWFPNMTCWRFPWWTKGSIFWGLLPWTIFWTWWRKKPRRISTNWWGLPRWKERTFLDATAFNVASKRLPWLIISLLGGLVTGGVIGVFEMTLEKVFALVLFIPVIMDMGGNVGTQSSTVFVRGLATGEIEISEVWRYFYREVKIGFTMGLVTGVMLAAGRHHLAARYCEFGPGGGAGHVCHSDPGSYHWYFDSHDFK